VTVVNRFERPVESGRMARDADPETPRSFGNYIVEARIGEGGMGAVYRARHPRLGRKVAVKVLHPDRRRDPGIVARFVNEARAANEIGDEHIVDVLDFGELEDGTPYLIMEWLDGVGLDVLLKQVPRLDLERAVHVFRGIAQALAAAHAHGIIHRDLKPENIFLIRRGDDREFVKVLDFGIAKLLQPGAQSVQTSTGDVFGTPLYMAPEQCRTSKTVDHRADIYALGLILYRMVTGRVPFELDGVGDLIIAHMLETPPAPRTLCSTLPEFVETALLKALAKEPADRFQSIGEFVRSLEPVPAVIFDVTPLPQPMISGEFPAVKSGPPMTPSGRMAAVTDPGADPMGQTAAPGSLPPPVNASAGPGAPAAPTGASTGSPASPAISVTSMPAVAVPVVVSVAAGRAPAPVADPAPSRRTRWPLAAAVAAVMIGLGGAGLLASGILRRPAPAEPSRAGAAPTPDAAPIPPVVAMAPPSAAPDAGAPPAGPTEARARIWAEPATAHITLDGTPVSNPFEASFARSDIRRQVVATAPGHAARSEWVAFDRDREIHLVLPKTPEPVHGRRRARSRPADPASPTSLPPRTPATLPSKGGKPSIEQKYDAP
jgi:serine/threonine-protein kinase